MEHGVDRGNSRGSRCRRILIRAGVCVVAALMLSLALPVIASLRRADLGDLRLVTEDHRSNTAFMLSSGTEVFYGWKGQALIAHHDALTHPPARPEVLLSAEMVDHMRAPGNVDFVGEVGFPFHNGRYAVSQRGDATGCIVLGSTGYRKFPGRYDSEDGAKSFSIQLREIPRVIP